MTMQLPLWLRRTLYALTVLGTPLVAYAQAKGWIGDLEVHLWEGLVTVASGVALFHSADLSQATITAPATVEVTGTDDDAAFVGDDGHESA